MPPIIHAVRHAQGWHNLSHGNYGLHDPELTPEGQAQCKTLCKNFPHHQKIDLLVASPMRRTLQTCLLGFSPEVDRGLQIIALPEAQETSDLPCDTGTDVEKLREEFAGKPVDWALVKEGWNSKEGQWAADDVALVERARLTRRWLKARPEKEIVLVSHGCVSVDWLLSIDYR